MGLALAFSIVKKHGGNFFMEATSPRGTSFAFYLPAIPVPKTIKKPQKNLQSRIGKVLLMDDDLMVREVSGRILKFLGYEVICAVDGREALKIYKENYETDVPIDVVLMDLTIPKGMGGKETMRRLLKLDPKARAIVSSGYADEPCMANYQEFGFIEAALKPFTIDELKEKISFAMSWTG